MVQEIAHFKVDVLGKGVQLLIYCFNLEQATILSSLLRTSENPAVLTVSHTFAPGKTWVDDSGNFDGEVFQQG